MLVLQGAVASVLLDPLLFYLLCCLAGRSHGVPSLSFPELSVQLLKLSEQITVSAFYLKETFFCFFCSWDSTFVRNSGASAAI